MTPWKFGPDWSTYVGGDSTGTASSDLSLPGPLYTEGSLAFEHMKGVHKSEWT